MDPYHCTSMEMSVFYDVPPFHAEVIANFLKESWAKKKTHTLNLCTCLVLVNGHNPQQIFLLSAGIFLLSAGYVGLVADLVALVHMYNM